MTGAIIRFKPNLQPSYNTNPKQELQKTIYKQTKVNLIKLKSD